MFLLQCSNYRAAQLQLVILRYGWMRFCQRNGYTHRWHFTIFYHFTEKEQKKTEKGNSNCHKGKRILLSPWAFLPCSSLWCWWWLKWFKLWSLTWVSSWSDGALFRHPFFCCQIHLPPKMLWCIRLHADFSPQDKKIQAEVRVVHFPLV